MQNARKHCGSGLAAVFLVLFAGPLRADQSGELRREADLLCASGNYSAALERLDALLERRPRDAEAHTKRGELRLRLNRAEPAIEDFDAATRLTPWSAAPVIDRGIALVTLGRYEAAERDFRWAIRLSSLPLNRSAASLASAHCGLGQIYHRARNDERAIAEYDLAIKANPNDPMGFVGRGEAIAASGEFERAVTDFSRAIELEPRTLRAFTMRGDAFVQLGRNVEALNDFEQALRLDPNDAKAHSFRGSLLAHLGKNEQALADFDEVIRLAPERASSYKDRGGVLVRLGRYEQAIADLNEAIRLDPRRPAAYLNRGAAYNALGQYERAIDDLEKAIKYNPNSAGARTNLGLALFAIGESERGLAEMSEAIRLDPKNAVVYLNRAGAFARIGMHQRAVDDYEVAIRLDPSAIVAHVGCARAYDVLGQPDLAIRAYDTAIELSPTDPRVFCDRGNAKRAEGDWQGAIADFTKAIALDRGYATAYVLRGWSLYNVGASGEADARAYLALQQRPDLSTAYMAILGALSARRAGREAEALIFADEALVKGDPAAWPSSILRYLKREISAETLLASATDRLKQTEAHAFTGLDVLQAGDREAALVHLRWVCDEGVAQSAAGELARVALGRLERERQVAGALNP